MTRFLALLLLAVLIYLLVSALVRRLAVAASLEAAKRQAGRGARSSAPRPAGPDRGERLVRCTACGVRLPESRALPPPGRAAASEAEAYCSEECRNRPGATP